MGEKAQDSLRTSALQSSFSNSEVPLTFLPGRSQPFKENSLQPWAPFSPLYSLFSLSTSLPTQVSCWVLHLMSIVSFSCPEGTYCSCSQSQPKIYS